MSIQCFSTTTGYPAPSSSHIIPPPSISEESFHNTEKNASNSIAHLIQRHESSTYRIFKATGRLALIQGSDFYTQGYNSIVSLDEIKLSLDNYKRIFPPLYNQETHYGYIEKEDLTEETKIFVHADLHGDLRSLINILRVLQDQGYFDEQFHVTTHSDGTPTIKIMFLEDYSDRGHDSFKVIQLLAELKMENPDTITLLRGNHEDLRVNAHYMADEDLFIIHSDFQLRDSLEYFYNTLPLSIYVAAKTNAETRREYTLFSHGLFDIQKDMLPLLASTDSKKRIFLERKKSESLSERVLSLYHKDTVESQDLQHIPTPLNNPNPMTPKERRSKEKQIIAASAIISFISRNPLPSPSERTMCNWGDITEETDFIDLRRGLAVTAKTTKDYFTLISGSTATVKVFVRGHQHERTIHSLKKTDGQENYGFIHTLPIGGSSPYHKELNGGIECFYIITLAPKVRDWNVTIMTKHVEASGPWTREENSFYGERKK